ncbi:histidine--tRNA ligase [Bradyrhizobium yuanmingense]|uniref:histidine--tRNA ligase n=1 Tax=Bradyrhizobium yuanmingense TaxID=108015 RepID=UPI003511E77F
MVEKIRAVYELYGFEPVETPAMEYTDALGKFLPDQDRPNEGVFSFQDDDEQWISLRYDLTAPLARYVAERYGTENLVLPYRSYRAGYVFRNEKPGPGRFRQFMQFDADTVGSASMAADAEVCMMISDAMEALGIPQESFLVKVNNRKLLDGLLEVMGLADDNFAARRLIVLRAIDKYDRLGIDGLRELLGPGRKDESGDFTNGANLNPDQIELVTSFCIGGQYKTPREIGDLFGRVRLSKTGEQGVQELLQLSELFGETGYSNRIFVDPSVVRGLEYYTGPVYEVELTFPIETDDGKIVRFGSVGGGGRYDGLVSRFRGEPIPATGISIGVSRLQAALKQIGKFGTKKEFGPVVVTIFDKDRIADYQRMVTTLRLFGIRAELYLGNPKNMGNQLKYADRRNSPCVIIQGSDEKARGEVQVKDLIEGAKAAAAIASNQEWRETRPAQFSCSEADLVAKVREVLARHDVSWG